MLAILLIVIILWHRFVDSITTYVMACYATSTIPRINYGSYASPRPCYPTPDRGPFYTSPYGALPKPPIGTVFSERVHDDDLTKVKTTLRRLLNENNVRNMPVGFPFHVTAQNCNEIRLSHAPYEFKEYLPTSDNRTRSQCATFSYSISRSGMMTWRITVPERGRRECEFYFYNRSRYASQPSPHTFRQ